MGFKTAKSKYFLVREDYADKGCCYVNKRIKKEISKKELEFLLKSPADEDDGIYFKIREVLDNEDK